jgi:hypothetical protein
MSEWVGSNKWRRLPDSRKREWKDNYWERGIKRTFDGEDRKVALTLPVELVVKQSLKFKLFSRGGKAPRPQIRDHRLQLQRCEILIVFSMLMLMQENRSNVTSVFDPSVNRVVDLALDQIKKTRERMRGNPPKVSVVKVRNGHR